MIRTAASVLLAGFLVAGGIASASAQQTTKPAAGTTRYQPSGGAGASGSTVPTNAQGSNAGQSNGNNPSSNGRVAGRETAPGSD